LSASKASATQFGLGAEADVGVSIPRKRHQLAGFEAVPGLSPLRTRRDLWQQARLGSAKSACSHEAL